MEDTSNSRTAGAIDVVDLNFSLDPDGEFTSTPMQANNRSKARLPSPSKSGLTKARIRSRGDLTRSFLSSHDADNDVERSVFQADQTGAPKQHYRPWRLSEPFTVSNGRDTFFLFNPFGEDYLEVDRIAIY